MKDTFAFIFPGQGSQQIGMLADYVKEPVVSGTLKEASELLGYDLPALFSEGPAAKLNQTEHTQPALLAASVALWRLWLTKCNPEQQQPRLMAGHSLGEYSALVCSGAITFHDAIILVKKRGCYMQEAVAKTNGSMAAVLGLDDDDVISICSAASQGQIVEAVNFNSPGQVVIAGNTEAVERAISLAKKANAKALLLPVSVPSHCSLMKTAAEKLKTALSGINIVPPSIPIVQNVSAEVCLEPEAIRNNLVFQLYKPVRWAETINLMHNLDVANYIECGPGKVLTGLNKRINRKLSSVSLESLTNMNNLLAV